MKSRLEFLVQFLELVFKREAWSYSTPNLYKAKILEYENNSKNFLKASNFWGVLLEKQIVCSKSMITFIWLILLLNTIKSRTRGVLNTCFVLNLFM